MSKCYDVEDKDKLINELVEALEIIRDIKGLSIESAKALAKEALLRVK